MDLVKVKSNDWLLYITFIQRHQNKTNISKNLFQLEVNPLKDQIIRAFFVPTEEERNLAFMQSRKVRRPKQLEFEQFARTFAVFRPIHKSHMEDTKAPNSVRNKVRFLFDMFDADSDGHVHKQEVYALLERMVGAEVR